MADLGLGCIVGPYFSAESQIVFGQFGSGTVLGYTGTFPAAGSVPTPGTLYDTVGEFEADFYGTNADGTPTGITLDYADGNPADTGGANVPVGTSVNWYTDTSLPNNALYVGFINDWYNHWSSALSGLDEALETFDAIWTDQLSLPDHDGYACVVPQQAIGWPGRSFVEPFDEVVFAGGGVSTLAFTTNGGGGQQTNPDLSTTNWNMSQPLQVIYLTKGSPVPPGPSGTFVADPTIISPGDSADLVWTSANTNSITIDHGVGSVSPVAGGSVSVSPSVTTTYTAHYVGDEGTLDLQATVLVGDPPTGTFEAQAETIYRGQSVKLSYTSENADSGSIDQGIGSIDLPDGFVTVSPTTLTTYTLTLTNDVGSITIEVTVQVNDLPPYIATFSEIRGLTYQDWEAVHGTDYEAFFEARQSLDDPSRKGNTPYIYTFMRQSTLGGEACDLEVRWDWVPEGATLRVQEYTPVYNYQAGRIVSVKKTRVRGKGRSIHVRYSNNTASPFEIKGWCIFYETNAQQ